MTAPPAPVDGGDGGVLHDRRERQGLPSGSVKTPASGTLAVCPTQTATGGGAAAVGGWLTGPASTATWTICRNDAPPSSVAVTVTVVAQTDRPVIATVGPRR